MSNYRRFYHEGYHLVFFTMVTYHRIPILIQNIEVLLDAFKYAKERYMFQIYACIILKDHLHMILELENNKDYSEIIRLIKYYFSLRMKNSIKLEDSKIKKREKGIWQRRFWEHTIKDDKDLSKHFDYIHYNSYKHYKIAPKDWNFSTFHKYVQLGFYDVNWCNFNNTNMISELDFE